MPASLSRIEREYVIRSLEDIQSPLSILSDNTLFHVPGSAYEIDAERITVTGLFPGKRESLPIRVFFRHKQRGLFFNSIVEQLADGRVVFGISGELFKEDLGTSGSGFPRISIASESFSFEAISTPSWPLDCVMVNPAVSLERAETIDKLTAKAGITAVNPLLSCRLFDYLDAFRSRGPSGSAGSFPGELFYLDHTHALVAFRNPGTATVGMTAVGTAQKLAVQIIYDSRTIRTNAILRGIIPVQVNLDVLCLSIDETQEEDKRFLFEKLHKLKYKG